MTGGWYRTKVRKYSKSGWMEDLPDLNTGKDYVVGMCYLLGLMFENWILFDNLILFYLLSLFHSGYRNVRRVCRLKVEQDPTHKLHGQSPFLS